MVRLCVLLWAIDGREAELYRYEDAVLALLGDHEGRLITRSRVRRLGASDPAEVQIIEFESQTGMDAYLADPRRAALSADRDAAVANTQILQLM